MSRSIAKREAAPPAAPQQQRALQAMQELSARYGMDSAALTAALRATVLPQVKDPKTKAYRDPTMGEVYGFVVTANAYRLNPFLKEIYAFPNKHGGMSPVVGVDGWISLMNREPQFDGIEFEWGGEIDHRGKAAPQYVTVRVFRKDRSHPIEVTEFFAECYRDTEPWNQMPRRMMRNKGIVQAGRVAFGFSGIYDEDEAHDQAPRESEYEVVEPPAGEPAPPRTTDDLADRMEAKRAKKAEPPADDYGDNPPDEPSTGPNLFADGDDDHDATGL